MPSRGELELVAALGGDDAVECKIVELAKKTGVAGVTDIELRLDLFRVECAVVGSEKLEHAVPRRKGFCHVWVRRLY
jgi:hypothetical protein